MSEVYRERIPLLDHGYIRLVEAWGRGDAEVLEAGIIEAARQSTQGNFRGWETDKKLLAFLFNGKPQHATPFEFAGAVIEAKGPIMVFREWHRHRIQSYAETLGGGDNLDDTAFNEMSARYAPLPAVDYVPTTARCFLTSQKNKQAGTMQGAEELTEPKAKWWLRKLEELQAHAQSVYEEGLQIGIPKEIARGATTVFRYSQMRATTNLRNWLAFMTLRSDPAAQWEIRQYADALGTILERTFPRTWELFNLARSPVLPPTAA